MVIGIPNAKTMLAFRQSKTEKRAVHIGIRECTQTKRRKYPCKLVRGGKRNKQRRRRRRKTVYIKLSVDHENYNNPSKIKIVSREESVSQDTQLFAQVAQFRGQERTGTRIA
jgi:hypothetical protein